MVGTLYLLAILNAVPPHPDLDVYLRGARDLAAGRPLYDPYLTAGGDPALRYGFIYPPLFAMLLWPLSLLPAGGSAIAWLVATHLALAATFIVVVRSLHATRPLVLLAAAVTLAFYPLWVDGSQGQANLPILLLVMLGIIGVSAGRPRAGLWIGLAAALKLTPALLILWLLWERKFRAAAWAVAGGIGVTALAALLRPMDSLTYVRDVLPTLARGTAYWSNQSIAGVAARLFTPNPYTRPVLTVPWEPVLVAVALLVVAGYWAMSGKGPHPALPREGGRESESPRGEMGLMRGLSFLPLLPLFSAVSWEHHLVILLPLVWLLLVTLSRRGWPLPQTAIFSLALLCLAAIPHLPIGPPYATEFARAAQTSNPLLIAVANRLLIGTLILFAASPWLLGLSRQSSAAAAVASRWLPPRLRPDGRLGTWSSSELDRPA
jgi:alpha-1,2-mannosyltransferase